MSQRTLAKEYKEHVFIKTQLEECLGFPLSYEGDFLPDYLKPYKTRVGIQLTEAANILAGFKPKEIINKSPGVDVILGYKDSLWDAVDNGVLSGTNELTGYDFNQEYRVDITLVKDEVTLWAKKHDFSWPFSLSAFDNVDSSKKESSDDTMKRLMAENERLKNELSIVKDRIPSLLGQYLEQDPLLMAIKLRNEEWQHYNEDERASAPASEYLIAKLKQDYNLSSNAFAAAIEKVACPIKR